MKILAYNTGCDEVYKQQLDTCRLAKLVDVYLKS